MVAEWAIGVFPRQTILRFHSLRGHVPLWQETADTFLPVGEPFCLGYVVPFFPRPDKGRLALHSRPYIGVFSQGAQFIVAHFLGSQRLFVKQHTPRPKRPTFYRLSHIKVYKRIRRPGVVPSRGALGRVVDVNLFFYCDPSLKNEGAAQGRAPVKLIETCLNLRYVLLTKRAEKSAPLGAIGLDREWALRGLVPGPEWTCFSPVLS